MLKTIAPRWVPVLFCSDKYKLVFFCWTVNVLTDTEIQFTMILMGTVSYREVTEAIASFCAQEVQQFFKSLCKARSNAD